MKLWIDAPGLGGRGGIETVVHAILSSSIVHSNTVTFTTVTMENYKWLNDINNVNIKILKGNNLIKFIYIFN